MGLAAAAVLVPAVVHVTTGSASTALAKQSGRVKHRNGKGGGITSVEVAVARSGRAISQVSLSGLVVPKALLTLSPTSAGRVSTLDVSAGQRVVGGQTIATLANPLTSTQIVAARDAVTTAQAKLQAASAAPTPQALAVASAGISKADIALSVATSAEQVASKNAQVTDQANRASAELGLAKAQDALAAAETAARDALATAQTSQQASAANAELGLAKAQDTLASAQQASQMAAPSDQATAQAAVTQAELGVQQAQLLLTEAQSPPPSAAVGQAQAAVSQAQLGVKQAQLSVAQAQSPPPSSSVAQAVAAVAQARAALALAKAQAAVSDAPVPPVALRPLVDAVAQAQDQARLVQIGAQESTITAPFTGTVVSVAATVGQNMSAGTNLATLQSSQLTIQAPLAQQDLALVHAGQLVTITVPGAPTRLTGVVAGISTAGTAGSLSFPVTIRVTDAAPWLLAGESASLQIVTATSTSAVLVPTQSIVSLTGVAQVFAVGANETAELVTVTPGVSDGATTAVTGLPVGTEVIAVGQTYLANGARVRSTGVVQVPASVTGSFVAGLASSAGAPATSSGKKGPGTSGAPGARAGAGGAATAGRGGGKKG